MNKIISFIIFSVFSFATINGNAQNFGVDDMVEIIIKLDGSKCLIHTVEAKQTLYNISRLYNIPVKGIMDYNNLTENDLIYQGNKIYIPLKHTIYTKKIASNDLRPIVYTIRPKDNLYAITHRYFDIQEEQLIEINNLASKNITIGQSIIIGWISFDKNYSEWSEHHKKKQIETGNKITAQKSLDKKHHTQEIVVNNNQKDQSKSENLSEKNIIVSDELTIDKHKKLEEFNLPIDDDVLKPKKEYITDTGVALWNKYSTDRTNSFVLHPTAKNNSVIELFNPLTNRTAYAKVIGHLPENTYESDVSILISPKVAERLGALDERFKIKMVYYTK